MPFQFSDGRRFRTAWESAQQMWISKDKLRNSSNRVWEREKLSQGKEKKICVLDFVLHSRCYLFHKHTATTLSRHSVTFSLSGLSVVCDVNCVNTQEIFDAKKMFVFFLIDFESQARVTDTFEWIEFELNENVVLSKQRLSSVYCFRQTIESYDIECYR